MEETIVSVKTLPELLFARIKCERVKVRETPDGVISLVPIAKTLKIPQTIEELFENYTGGAFQAQIQEFEAVGNELW